MDFSLLQPHARNSFLRDITAIRPIWVYYVVMIVDPILRFSWIFYAIFTHNTQHNTIVSFLISFAEVIRRGMWTVFRVENEHCGNVAQYKASRDTPLPYRLETLVEEPGLEAAVGVPSPPQGEDAVSPLLAATSARTTGADIPGSDTIAPGSMAMPPNQADEAQPEEGSGTFRRRRADTLGRKSILRVMAEAHKQDFEKRRPTEDVKGKVLTEPEDELHSEEEDDEDEDSGSLQEERMQIREAETLLKRGTPGRDDDADDDGRE
ncbi:EXS family-domain-containing protein [Podospora didyma]|uniref:EXS family-domain-containing protein n=1 Tax=Podospora didyma TaxID=330526 RepID=A0AAE0NCL6_9PEZI|nr:EXS family-domain-containing protein [Podospora didyma]